MERPLKVCYFGTYRAEYSRNRIMIDGLRLNDVTVIECHERLWHGIEDRVNITRGGWFHPKFWLRVISTYIKLLNHHRKIRDYDVLVVGYPGQFDVYLARLLSWVRRKPLVWDVFMSIYLIALERGLDQTNRLIVGIIRRIERLALRLPDLLIQDTAEYVTWFEENHGISPEHFNLVPTGADERIFHPITEVLPESDTFLVIYYGTFIPNHGVTYIVETAHLLSEVDNIQFEMIGTGPEQEKAALLAQTYQLENISFIPWLEKNELVRRVARADICLGAFGITPQSLMTIQNKIFEGCAMGKAVITGDSPATRSVFHHLQDIFLCDRSNPGSLAEAIKLLKEDTGLREHIAHNGADLFREHFTIEKNGHRFESFLRRLIQ